MLGMVWRDKGFFIGLWGYDYGYEPGSSILNGSSGAPTGSDTLKRDDSTDPTRGFAVRSRK